ncbi:MAG: response regulator [Tannerella sp.]|jgi:ligand-binding sensor domain-containing protein/AraC-like DNA-binding protein/nitrogen-specific signal transduction histidine kinase|nr:response regulator [Tannerella sp.]
MKNRRKLCWKVTGLLALGLLCSEPANGREVFFTNVRMPGGLSLNTVRAIATDKNGFVWVGTLDGLVRFDGYNMRVYRTEPDNPSALTDLRIRSIYADRDGYIWIKTYQNVFSCYNPVNDSFHNYTSSSYTDWHETASGDIWLWNGSSGALRIRKTAAGLEERIFTLKEFGLASCNFLFEDSQGAIWTGGKAGLCRTDSSGMTERIVSDAALVFNDAAELNGKVWFITADSRIFSYDLAKHETAPAYHYPHEDVFVSAGIISDSELLIVLKSDGVRVFDTGKPEILSKLSGEPKGNTVLIKGSKGNLFLLNQNRIILYFDPSIHALRHIRLEPDDKSTTIDAEHFFTDSKGTVWIGTYGNGLYRFDPNTCFTDHYINKADKNSLASNYLLSFAEDCHGNLWIGSEYAGVIKALVMPDFIRTVRPEMTLAIGKNNNIRAVCEDSRGAVWVGAKNGSLFVYDSTMSAGRCIGENLNAYALVEDGRHRMWASAKNDGVYLYDVEKGAVSAHYANIANDPSSLGKDPVFDIMTDSQNRVWLATFGGGVNLAEEQPDGSYRFRHFFENQGDRSNIRCLCQDSNGRIWCGSQFGIIRFDPEEIIVNPDSYTVFNHDPSCGNSLSNNDIKTIFQDSEGNIWIGTAGGGLNLYREEENFIHYTVNEGLADNFIMGLMEDGDNLWISSENGLTCHNRTAGSFSTYHFAETPYGNNFVENAFTKRRNGDMLWGSLDGLLVFTPSKFNPAKDTSPVLITEMNVEGVSDFRSISDKSITYADNIILNHKQNTFTLEFSTLIFRNPEASSYTFILENFDKQWSPVLHDNSATYKNIPYGKYVFKVKGVNNDGEWNENVTTLDITITPPWWKSTVAYFIYLLIACCLIYASYQIVLKFNRLNNALEVEKQLTDYKLRFFTNISHEFRSPLTLICGAVENLNSLAGLPQAVSKQIKTLSRNSLNLTRLIDQLLEFRKLQNKVLTLDLEETDIIDFTRDIYSGYTETAEQKQISYTFSPQVDEYKMFIDRKKIDKIIYNLLSNAFKFTPRGGAIDLSVGFKADTCIIRVKDNGSGVPGEKQHLLFSRFMQINFSSTGTGVGLSLVREFAEVHKGRVWFENNPECGSIFALELPTSKDAYEGANFITLQPLIPEKYHAESPVEESAAMPESLPDKETLTSYKLLIIDDNDDIRGFLSDEFCKYLTVEMAEDGEQGLYKAREISPDLIICDVMMPGIDGFDVTRRLKSDFETCHIPVILLTAHSSLEHRLEGVESGADVYVTKPFSLKYIVRQVLKLIELREQLKLRFSRENKPDVSSTATTDRDKVFYEKIINILDHNYPDSGFTINKFAEEAGIRRTLFFSKIKGLTGMSPNELIKVRRLQEARTLLAQGDLNISEVSFRVGFEDPLYFSKCFKKQYGASPSKMELQDNRATASKLET